MRLLVRALIALATVLPIACSAADGGKYVEGTHYKLARDPAPAGSSKRIAVEEFFWYGCGHCYAFEPAIEAWKAKKPADVDFVRVPNSLGRPVGIAHSKVLYTAESLNVMDKVHKAFFAAIHQQRRNLDSEAAIQAFFTEQTGIMPDVFNSTYSGFAVDSRVRRAEELSKRYGVASTPTLVIDGRYLVNASMAGGFEQMLKITDFLIEKTRKLRTKK